MKEKTKMLFLFRSAIAYTTSRQKLLSNDAISRSKSIQVYDSTDADVLRSFQEFNLASVLYYTMKENATAEQSSRMTAMDNATKNAGELINKLTTYYNRTRQSVITTELIEIISGAAALEEKK
jgi:F-type H+-transporting ATPase subunit gamma